MKKIFKLQEENKKPERVIESVKHEIRKYLKRERKKKLPENAKYWDFDCKFGATAETATVTTSYGIITELDKALEANWSECYIEIFAHPTMNKPVEEEIETTEES